MPFGLIAARLMRQNETPAQTLRLRSQFRAVPEWLKSILTPNVKVCRATKIILSLGWIAAFVTVWSLDTASFLPTPMEVIRAFPDLLDADLWTQLLSSLTLNLTAGCLIFLISLAIAYSSVTSVGRALAELVSCGRFNGMVGLPLIFLSLLHSPPRVKVALLVFGVSVFTVLSLTDMIQAIPSAQFDLARTLRMSRWRSVWEVVVLGRFDEVLNIMRGSMAMSWMLLPLVEGYFKFEGGVGALSEIQNKYLRLDVVFCLLLVITVCGFLQDLTIKCLRGIVCPFADLGTERG